MTGKERAALVAWLNERWGDDYDIWTSREGKYWGARFRHPRPASVLSYSAAIPAATVIADSARELDAELEREQSTVALYWERMETHRATLARIRGSDVA